ncbi:MAG TPA: hypothetical protein PK453_28650, partial [Leptospiraceae bacterium]|nr:hypothetical protein [Leptospiraceae bacterium]
ILLLKVPERVINMDALVAHENVYNNYLIVGLPEINYFKKIRNDKKSYPFFKIEIWQHIEYCFFDCDAIAPFQYRIIPALPYKETDLNISKTDFGQVLEDFRGNCEYLFPLARVKSGNVYFDYTIKFPFGKYSNTAIGTVKTKLEPNQSIELIFDSEKLQNVTYKIVPTPNKMKKCQSPEGLGDDFEKK